MEENCLDDIHGIEPWLKARKERVLLIDAGGVLFNNVIEDSTFVEDLAGMFSVGRSQLLAAYSAEEGIAEAGHADVHHVMAGCLRRLGCRLFKASEFAQIDMLYAASIISNVQMFAALRSLRGQGHILVLANNEAERWDRIKHGIFCHFDLFDRHGSSWKVGACKPTAKYFEQLDRLLYPYSRSDWHLLDDNARVVTEARSLNVAATRYAAGLGTYAFSGILQGRSQRLLRTTGA